MINNAQHSFTDIMEWIKGKESILILTHRRPDGDALGSLIGMFHCLHKMNINATPYVTEAVSERYRSFMPEQLVVGSSLDMAQFDAVICLDAANEKRVDAPNGKKVRELSQPCCNIDHHIDNPRYGEINHVDSRCSATAEILTLMMKELALPVSAETATALILGIITDTGSFRFNNTTSQTLRSAAWLKEKNGDYDKVVNEVYYNEPFKMLKFRAKLLEELRFSYDNHLAYFILTDELMSRYGVAADDTEEIVDIARVIKGVEIVCRIQNTNEGVRYSLRSMNPEKPILEIAHKLGGGGHALAAGALVKDISVEKGEELLLAYVGEFIYNN